MIGDELVRGAPAQRWTLAFIDRGLERAYLDAVALSLRTPLRVLAVLTGVIAVASWWGDPAVQVTDGNVEVVRYLKLAWLYPATALGIAFVFAPTAWYTRGLQLVETAALASVLGFNLAAALLMPDPEAVDAKTSMLALSCVTVAWCMLGSLRFVYVAPVAILGSAAIAAAIAARWPQALELEATVGWQLSGAIGGSLAAYVIERRGRRRFVAEQALATERARSDRLLRNMLPEVIAERLKDGGRIADHFDEATVLFADLVGFTALAEQLSAAEVVDALDDLFSAFDDAAERLGLEKIKTIGDAYMVVGGVPTPRADHAVAVAQMALAMRRAVQGRRLGDGLLSIRIGIHSGPVVAGVIGKRKFLYDLWGDTVNTASRLESHGLPGEIQISAQTRALLDGSFAVAPRGTVSLKGKGEVETWLLRDG